MQLGGAAIFCDTFDKKNPGIPSRTGDLDPNVWEYRVLPAMLILVKACTTDGQRPGCCRLAMGRLTVTSPNDIMICNGQLREASSDNYSGVFDDGTVTLLAMYPKQPLDFGRKDRHSIFRYQQ